MEDNIDELLYFINKNSVSFYKDYKQPENIEGISYSIKYFLKSLFEYQSTKLFEYIKNKNISLNQKLVQIIIDRINEKVKKSEYPGYLIEYKNTNNSSDFFNYFELNILPKINIFYSNYDEKVEDISKDSIEILRNISLYYGVNPIHVSLGVSISSLINKLGYTQLVLQGSPFIPSLIEKGRKVETYGYAGPGYGYGLRGGVLIHKGDGDNYIGLEIEGGILVFYGDIKDYGFMNMKGGSVTLIGNTGKECFNAIGGGKVYVKGNIGKNSLNDIYGGKIIVDGNVDEGSLKNIYGGEIIVNGKKYGK
ncbi:hypothetical protein YN1_5260 [Nanoarchaeota archaeon]